MRRRPTRSVLALTALAVLAGCDSSGSDAAFSASVDPPTVVLANRLDRTVYFVAIEERTAPTVDLSDDLADWDSVAAGGRAVLPFDRIIGYEPGAERGTLGWKTREGDRSGSIRLDLD